MNPCKMNLAMLTRISLATALLVTALNGLGATYEWSGTTSGTWDPGVPANWNGVSPTFDFQADLTFSTTGAANFDPTFLGNSDRTVRALLFNANVSSPLKINLDDNAGTSRILGFSSDSGASSISVESGAAGAISIGSSGLGSISLSSDLNITNLSSTSVLSLNRPIVEAVTGRGIRKYGPGKVILQSDGTSDWSGTTIIRGGTLELGANDSISDFSTLTVAAGTLDLKGYSDTMYMSVTMGDATTAEAGSTPAISDTAGGGMLYLSGASVGVVYAAGSPGFNNGTATIGASLDLKGASHNFSVANSTETSTELVISGPITGTGSIQKLGQGTMVLAAVNTYTNAAADFFTTHGDGILKLGVNQAIPPTTIMAINRGSFDIDGKVQDLTKAAIRLGSGAPGVNGLQVTVVDSVGGGLFRPNGVQYNAGNAGGQNGQATISATLDLNGAYRFFTIADSTYTNTETVITGTITNSKPENAAGPIKGGAGVLVLAGTNTYNGNLGIRQGTVKLGSAGAHPLVGVGVTCLSATAGTTATFDIAGYQPIATYLALGFDNTSSVNSKNTIIDSASGGLLTLFGGVTYTNGAAGKNNGQATISANLDLGGTNRFFYVGDSDQTATEVVISGKIGNAAQTGAGFTKAGPGVLSLSGANTYDGATVVEAGALVVTGAGSIASSTNVTVQPGALLDVSGVTGGFTLAGAQTLSGGGNIKGPVLANGTVAPMAWGAPAALNLTNNLQLGGSSTAALLVGKSGGELAGSQVRVISGDLIYGGKLQVSLASGTEPLGVGDTFTLFTASGTIGGSFNSIVLPAGYTWNTNLLSSGKLEVTGMVTAVPTAPTNINMAVAGGTMTISWPSEYTGWSLQVQTNSAASGLSSNWITVEGSSTVSSMSFPVDTSNPSVFYRLFYQP